jgi:uncharacterized protein YecA (UPF0149 family)
LNCVELFQTVAKALDDDMDDLGDPDNIDEDVLMEFDSYRKQSYSNPQQKYTQVNDIAEELKWWHWTEDARRNPRMPKTKKIDRHGPCPCGSGRMYKKCCGN